MTNKVKFYSNPSELDRYKAVIRVADSNRNTVGVIRRSKQHNEISFKPQWDTSFGLEAMQDIVELMKAIKSDFHELAEQLIEESQSKKKASSDEYSATS